MCVFGVGGRKSVYVYATVIATLQILCGCTWCTVDDTVCVDAIQHVNGRYSVVVLTV